jgi:hypothetical protein
MEFRSQMVAMRVDLEIADGIENFAGALEIRSEFLVRKWPAAVGDPRSDGEIDRIHRLQAEPAAASPAPPVAGAPEGMSAKFAQIHRHAEVLGNVRIFDGGKGIEAAAFNQTYPNRRIRQFAGDG